MAKLLHIASSPRDVQSVSRQVAQDFLTAYAVANPSDVVETIDLWSYPLPDFNGPALTAKAKVMRKLPHNEDEVIAWARIESEARKLHAFDKLLFSIPMWNWSIPFVLKRYIDVVTQPGLLFSWSPTAGYEGLLPRPAAVIYSSSFDYGSDSPMAGFDHQKAYVEHWLRIIGCRDVRTITVAPTAGAPKVTGPARERASREAREVAQAF